jgi:hypothetical protein
MGAKMNGAPFHGSISEDEGITAFYGALLKKVYLCSLAT